MKAVTKLTQLAFIADPKQKIGHAVELIYPPEWLDKKPEETEMGDYATNRDMAVDMFLARIPRTRAQTFLGNIGQTAACLRHNVSDARLTKLKETGLPIIVFTGTVDNLVNPKNSHHLSKVLECPLKVYEGSGHAIPSEQPIRYNKDIDQHFTKAAESRK